MKNIGKVFALTIVIIIGCLTLFIMESNSDIDMASRVSIICDDGQEKVKIWSDEGNKKYVFLPSYADLEKVYFQIDPRECLSINGTEAYDGMSCAEFEIGKTYTLTYDIGKREHSGEIVFLKSSNVATMFIDTASGKMDYVHSQKGNEETCDIAIYDASGELNYNKRNNSINGRGNTTWTDFDKKPYSITLSENADLLGMGAADKWVLLANASDPSHLRNKITFEFAREIGLMYSPDSQWIDLYLNGEYAGLYLLCEKNEIHRERVDIGTYENALVSLELEQRLIEHKDNYVLTDGRQALKIHYGDDTEEIDKLFQSVENALLAEDGYDILTGKHWTELIDIDSWAKKTILEELSGNFDANFISQFFYINGKGTGKTVYAGPVWDYDNSFGNRNSWQISQPTVFLIRRQKVGMVYGKTYETPWIAALYSKEDFYNRLTCVFESIVYPKALLLVEEIESYCNEIYAAAHMNQIRWKEEANIREEAAYLIEFLETRISFLWDIWVEKYPYCQVILDPIGGHYAYWTAYYGKCLEKVPDLPDNEYLSFEGWYYLETDEPFDKTAPITEDTQIYAKWEDTPAKRVRQIMKLIPLGVIAVIGFGLLTVEISRIRRVKQT